MADTLHVLGRCIQEAEGPAEEAEGYFQQALRIKEAVAGLGEDADEDPQVEQRIPLRVS